MGFYILLFNLVSKFVGPGVHARAVFFLSLWVPWWNDGVQVFRFVPQTLTNGSILQAQVYNPSCPCYMQPTSHRLTCLLEPLAKRKGNEGENFLITGPRIASITSLLELSDMTLPSCRGAWEMWSSNITRMKRSLGNVVQQYNETEGTWIWGKTSIDCATLLLQLILSQQAISFHP